MRRSGSEASDDRPTWQSVRPAFDHPLSWSVPFGRIGRTALRVHAAMFAFIVIELVRHVPPPRAGVSDPVEIRLAAIMLASVLLVIALRESVSVQIARRLGIAVPELVLWPMGSLRSEPLTLPWRRAFPAAAAGPMVSVVLFLLLAPVLGGLTGVWWTVAIPSPLHPPDIGALTIDGRQPLWLLVLGTFHRVHFMFMVLALLPIEPLDGARLVRAVARRFASPADAAIFAGRLGVLASVPLLALGILIGAWMVIALAIIGGAIGLHRLRQEAWLAEELGALASGAQREDPVPRTDAPRRRRPLPDGADGVRASTGLADDSGADDDLPEVTAGTDDAAQLDRVLEKIARQGMAALDEGEREILRRSTEQRRGASPG